MSKKSRKEKYESEILEVIEKKRIFQIQDIFAFYNGCSSSTFYNHELEKLESIKDALRKNKIITKQALKQKWAQSDNATLQIALFKLICEDDERQKLNQQHIDHTSKGDKVFNGNIVFNSQGTEPDEE